MKKILFVLLTIVVVIACSKTENPATTYLPLTKENIAECKQPVFICLCCPLIRTVF